MNNLSFEQKVLLLMATPSGDEKQKLINKFSTDPVFASRYFIDAVSLEKYMEINKERFAPVAQRAAALRKEMKNKGWTDKKYQKYLGEIPEALEVERPEFSKTLPQKIRDNNIRAFFKKYPAFRVDS